MTTRVVATSYGDPGVLAVVEEPVGEPGPDQVVLRVRAAGTNPVDYKVFSGMMGADPDKLPMPVGMEAAGVVTAVSGQSTGPMGEIHVGDEVIAYPITGAYAADVVVPASSVVPKPSSMSFEQASGLMLTGTTAVHALEATGVRPGETVLVHGASGGVGLMVVQLAVALGARVIGTASESQHAHLRELGAEPVAYGEGLVARVRAMAPDGVDVALDLVGTDEALDSSVELVTDKQRIATIAGFQRAPELGIRALGGGPGAEQGTSIRAAARAELVRRVQAGELTVTIDSTYPLAQASDADRKLAEEHTHGKIVLIP